jgi:hypothetical protein
MRLVGTEDGGGVSEYCFTPWPSVHTYCATASALKPVADSITIAAATRGRAANFMAIPCESDIARISPCFVPHVNEYGGEAGSVQGKKRRILRISV